MWWHFAAADAREAEWLRPAFAAYLRARAAADTDYGAAELIFGELVGNVMRHACGEIDVRIDWPPNGCPTLTVSDRGPGFTLRPALPGDLFEENGRGLFLVAAFSRSLTVRRRAGGGAVVRVELAIQRDRTRTVPAAADAPFPERGGGRAERWWPGNEAG